MANFLLPIILLYITNNAFALTEEQQPARYRLVDQFTAFTLDESEVKIGTNLDYGLTDQIMIGTDLVADILGAPSLQSKFYALRRGQHSFALGLRIAYLNKQTLLWGSMTDHFEVLTIQIIRPSISWTNSVSERLNIHSYWSVGFGTVKAKLSEKGKRRLWEAKHPNGDYQSRQETQQQENQEQTSNDSSSNTYAYRTAQVSSLTGLLSDIFQISGEFQRESGNKIVITSRIERTDIEDLQTNGFRLTAGQQWIWDYFQIRLGIGLQYLVISGRDLDGEKIDAAGIVPASDIDFYWRF